jgi:hypothetical protein
MSSGINLSATPEARKGVVEMAGMLAGTEEPSSTGINLSTTIGKEKLLTTLAPAIVGKEVDVDNIPTEKNDTTMPLIIPTVLPDLDKDQSNYLDIAGDLYVLTLEKDIRLAFKSKREFYKNYNTTNVMLFRRMFSKTLSGPVEERFKSLDKSDRIALLKSLQFRIDSLEEQLQLTNSLASQSDRRILNGLIDLKSRFEAMSGKPAPVHTTLGNAPTLLKMLKDKDQTLEAILRIAWYLVNPDKIPQADIQRFESIVNAVGIQDIIKNIRSDEDLPEDIRTLKSMNYFDRVKLKNIVEQPTVGKSMDEVRSELVTEPSEKILRRRIEQILQVFQLHKFINKETADDMLAKIHNDSTFNPKLADIDSSMIDKIAISLDPIYKFYRSVYFPVYDVIARAMTPNLEKYNMNRMLRIFGNAMSYINGKREENGIYKLVGDGIPETQMLMNDIINYPDFQDTEFLQTLKYLPDFILKQFEYKMVKKEIIPPDALRALPDDIRAKYEKRKEKKGKLRDVAKPHLKNIKFFTLDNIAIPTNINQLSSRFDLSKDEQQILIDRIKSFFVPDAIYMFVEHKNDDSQNLFKLYTPIPTKEKRAEFKTPLSEKAIPIKQVLIHKAHKKDAVSEPLDYINYTILALSILILFKSRMPAGKNTIDFEKMGEIEESE